MPEEPFHSKCIHTSSIYSNGRESIAFYCCYVTTVSLKSDSGRGKLTEFDSDGGPGGGGVCLGGLFSIEKLSFFFKFIRGFFLIS